MIFIKNPIEGKVKTRLGKDIGHLRAVEIYKRLLEHTRTVALDTQSRRWLWYGDYVNNEDSWAEKDFDKKLQKGDSLGDRMNHAFEEAFDQGFERVVIIGSDCPEITEKTLSSAFEALDEYDVAIGPANDGGYYLLGMRKKVNLFNNKSWSEESVFEDTISDIQSQKLSYKILEELTDLDTIEDLKKFPEYDTSN